MGGNTAKIYLERIKQKETSAEVDRYIAEGTTHRSNKNFGAAIKLYKKALAIDPENGRTLEYMGYSLFRLGKYDQALQQLEKASNISSSRVNVLINLVKVHCAKDDYSSALTVIRENKETLRGHKATYESDSEIKDICKEVFKSLPE